jgi:hypothetical protein
MALQARNTTGGGSKEQPPVGTHLARCVGLVDLGHQPSYEWQGKTVDSQFKVVFIYELVNENMEDGRPFWVDEDVKVSDYEPTQPGKVTSKMMARVRTLDGHDGDTNNGQALQGLIGKPCMVEVYHNDKGYANIKDVAGCPKGFAVPELRNPPIVFNTDEEDVDTFLKFPEFRQNKIKNSLDFVGSGIHGALLKAGLDEPQQPDV